LARCTLRRSSPLEVLLLVVFVVLGCRRHRVRPHRITRPAPSVSATAIVTDAAAPPRVRSIMLTLASGNTNPLGKPNVWAYVPASYREDGPLRLLFVFHGFNNCLESFVSDVGVACRPGDPARAAADLAAQIDRSGTSAIALVPQLAYDEKSGDPGVLSSGAALEKLSAEALDKLGIRKLEEVERVAMIAISGGYRAMYATLGAFGDRLRDVYLLDAYYAPDGPVDAWLWKNLGDFTRDAANPRHLGVIYTSLVVPQGASRALAARVLATGIDAKNFVHNGEAHDVTIEELRTPIAFLYSNREHDDVPRADIEKVIAASGL
jgi:hypothetical protein